MDLCRNFACGCAVSVPNLYCEMCAEYTPICPVCAAVYGEHRLDCTVADGYDDCGEGPWDTEEDAREFAEAEVGLAWDVVRGGSGKWFVLVKEND